MLYIRLRYVESKQSHFLTKQGNLSDNLLISKLPDRRDASLDSKRRKERQSQKVSRLTARPKLERRWMSDELNEISGHVGLFS